MKLVIVAALLLLNVSQSFHMEMNDNDLKIIPQVNEEKPERTLFVDETPKHRTKRGIWDIFQKMVITKNLIVDQYTDTKNSLNEVYNMFNSQFSDPAPTKPTRPSTSTESPKISSEDSSEVKTTTERYSITRYEFGRILGRNFRGLQRLADLEFKDALNATHYNLQEYRAEASKQFANSLAAEKKKQLKALVKG